MRIGIDLCPLAFGNLTRGIGIYAEHLVLALAEMDRTNQYVLFVHPQSRIEWLGHLPTNFQTLFVPFPPIGRAAPLLSHQFTLPRLARRLQLDVLHCIATPMNPSTPSVPWRQTVPTVVTVHDLSPLVLGAKLAVRWRYQSFYRFTLSACRRAAHLIADSESTARDLVKFGIANEDRITVALLAAPQFRKTDNPPSESIREILMEPFVLHVGGADYTKNQELVMRAFALLIRRTEFTHRLVLVGSHHLNDMAFTDIEPRIRGRVMRLVNLTRSDLYYLYQACAVFISPSRYEGFGLPLLEAMSTGAPVIAANTSSITEVVGNAAILIESEDIEGFAEAMQRLITECKIRGHYIQAGYERAKQFSWTQTAEATRQAYERVASRKSFASRN